ncbi:hypothetical protein MTO96_024562 [Rhipicephalus appendiculatus]
MALSAFEITQLLRGATTTYCKANGNPVRHSLRSGGTEGDTNDVADKEKGRRRLAMTGVLTTRATEVLP